MLSPDTVRFSNSATLAWRNVFRHGWRSTLVVATVAFGVTASILANSFVEWILWATRETTIHSQFGHIELTKRGYLQSGGADPFSYLIPENSPVRDLLEHMDHVRVIAPRIAFSGLVSRADATLSFVGEGVQPEKEAAMSDVPGLGRPAVNIVKGMDLSTEKPYEIVMGEGLAANMGVNVGDTVTLLAHTKSGGMNGIDVRIRGIFSTISKVFDDSAVRVPRRAVHELLRVSGDQRIVVLLDDTNRTDEVLGRLRRQLAGQPVDATPWYELADFYNKTAALFSRQTALVKLLLAIIIVLSVSNTMTMNISERVGEIGTAMALGTHRARILEQFVIEGGLLGVVGGIVGSIGGVLAARVISMFGIPMPAPPGQSWGYSAEMMVTGPIITSSIVLAVMAALLATLYPAWKASRLQIVNALRHNR
jgi:putative ABC transport system permease protein